MSANQLALNFNLHKKQAKVLISTATEILYGGAAGGGKSFLARVLAILYALEIPGINIFIFRRLYSDLQINHVEGPTGFRAILAPFINTKHPQSPLIGQRLADIVEGEIRFWNGSKIFLCHLQHQKDLTKYYGPEFHVLILEEATQFSEFMIRFLRSRLRIPDTLKIPDKYLKPKSEWRNPNVKDYYFPKVIYTSNPGGVGHSYIKRSFVEGYDPFAYHNAPDDDGGHVRQYIPARVDDNPSVNIAEVKANLAGLPPALVDALLNGNWDAVIGAYFPQADPSVHVIKPFQIPDYWPRMMSMDWGACGGGDPFSLGWWTTSDGSIGGYPRGSLICYRRWYGKDLPKITAHEVARGIRAREARDPTILYRVAGGDIVQVRGSGPSVFEIFDSDGIHFSRADMRRYPGWQQIQERLIGNSGRPAIYWFEDCEDDLEYLMTLQHDLNDPNDCAKGEDHAPDQIRYMCMGRPWVKDQPPQPRTLQQSFRPPTLNDMWKIRDGNLFDDRRR